MLVSSKANLFDILHLGFGSKIYKIIYFIDKQTIRQMTLKLNFSIPNACQ